MDNQERTQEEIKKLYADGPTKLLLALVDLTGDQYDLAPADGGWSIRQIVHHLVDGDDLWKTPIMAALGNSEGIFHLSWYWDVSQDRWAIIWDYAGRPIAPALERLQANRSHALELLEHAPGGWDRTINILRPNGETVGLSAGTIITMQADLLMAHLSDIHAIRSEHQLELLDSGS